MEALSLVDIPMVSFECGELAVIRNHILPEAFVCLRRHEGLSNSVLLRF